MKYKINNRSYAYDIAGEGPPLVLLHGFTGTRQTWEPFISKWKEQHTVIRLDMPGHGQTICPEFPSMNEFCQDLSLLIDDFNYTSVSILGYSLGGRTALQFANLHPDKVDAIILESASPGLTTEEERQQRIKNDHNLAERIETEGLETFVNRWENTPLFGSQKSLPLTVKRNIRNERLSQTAKGLASSLRYMGTGVQDSVWEQLQTIEIPILLLAGSLDVKFVKTNELMNKLLPNSQFKIISDVGHAIHVENPQQFDTVVIDFLNTVTQK